MNDFLSDLYAMLMEELRAPIGDPEYRRAMQELTALEEQVKEKIGLALLDSYQRAQDLACRWEDVAIFTCGLRFGARFALAVLSPQSSQTSAP